MYKIELRTEEEKEKELIHRDRGVRKVIQSTKAIDRAEARANRSPVTMEYSGYRIAPGYIVQFTSESYTIEEHFATIGQSFAADVISGLGYYAHDLTESQIDAVFSDPNVDGVTQNSYGKWC